MLNFSQCLSQKEFCILVEHLSTAHRHDAVQNIAGFSAFITLADRVHADDDLAPLEVAKLYPTDIEKILHFSGKGRDIAEFEEFLQKAQNVGIKNLLLLTGDKLKGHVHGTSVTPRTRYLESVNAVMAAKKHGGFYIGVAFNPFKYAEAERDAQYLKLHKKIKAGADFIVTQLGYDIDALKQTQIFLKHQHYPQRILACVMPLSYARANFMFKNKVAGIVITPHMLHVLAEEKQAGLQNNAYKRCALQILICQHLGFSGIHLSACHKPTEQKLLENYLEQYQNYTLDELESRWNTLWQVKSGKEFTPQLDYFSRQPTSSQLIKYQHLHFMHEALFESQIAKGIGQFIFKASFWDKHTASKMLMTVEFITKHGVVGCESCGQCRLSNTLYICPETCPKGLANGPCGGTTLDRCEFGDRECIHSVKARLAKAVGQTALLHKPSMEGLFSNIISK